MQHQNQHKCEPFALPVEILGTSADKQKSHQIYNI